MERPRILLADDSVTIRKVVELTFADEGIDVVCVGDGDAAMVSFVESEPDLVIADVNMPGVGGYMICEMIKQDDSTRDIPVILLTGSFEPFDPGEASRVGANYYFTKPFQSIPDLVAKVRELLQAKTSDGLILAETEDIDGLYKDSFADTLKIEGHSTVPELGYEGMDAEIAAHQAEAIEHEKNFPEDLTVADLGYEGMDDELPIHQPNSTKEEFPKDLTVADLGYEGMDDEIPLLEVGEEIAAESRPYAFAEVNDPFSTPIDLGDASLDDEMIETSRPGEILETEADDSMAIHVADTLRFDSTQPVDPEFRIDPFATPITTDDTIAKYNWSDEAAELVKESEPEEYQEPYESANEEPSTLLKFEFAENDADDRYDSVREIEPEFRPVREETLLPVEPEAEAVPNIEYSPVEPEAESVTEQTSSTTEPENLYPPELIEMIAQRVIEHLSDKVIREVAMEVVPKITENMIREALGPK